MEFFLTFSNFRYYTGTRVWFSTVPDDSGSLDQSFEAWG